MEKNAKGLLPKIEVIIVGVFALSFLIWIVPKCGGGGGAQDELPEELLVDSTQARSASEKPAAPPAKDSTAKTAPVSTTAAPARSEPQYAKLYVTIDGLNLRNQPGLKSPVVAKLPLFEEVYFLNEVTDTTSEVSLGYEKVREPWVKIRTRKGQEGWVFGAGVNYYRKKRSGTLE